MTRTMRIPNLRAAGGLVAIGCTVSVQAGAQGTAPATAGFPMIPGEGLRGGWADFRYRIRTRLHFDLADPRMGEIGRVLGASFDDTTDVRRARVLADLGFADGSPLAPFGLRAQFDFADGLIEWNDLALDADLPASLAAANRSSVRAGQFREPFGFEAMTSVSHLPFIERSVASNTFTPGRSRGARWSAAWDGALLQVGHFRRTDGLPFPHELLEEAGTTARLVIQGDEQGLAQVGASASYRDLGGDPLLLGGRPGTRLLPRVVDTGSLAVDDAWTGGVEALVRAGPWTAYAEGFGAWVDASFLTGAHVGVTAFLNGGESTWNRRRGGLRAPAVPDVYHDRTRGDGAVEAALRVTWVDLDDGDVRGGRSLDVEAGLNWYLQPATRVMLHWVGLRVDAPTGEHELGSLVLGRVQVQF